MKLTRAFLGMALASMLSYGCFCLVAPASSKNVSIISIDPLISDRKQQEMVTVLESKYYQKPETWCSDVQKQFPHIKKISMTYTVPGVPTISIQAFAPRLRVNNEYVLLENGKLVAKDSFQESYLNQLTEISVAMPLVDQSSLLNFSEELTPLLYERFAITWHNATQIKLQDKQNQHFMMMCECTNLPTASVIQRCETIYQNIKEQQLTYKKNPQGTCVTDIRFEKQIIAYIAKEGCDGQRIA